MQKLRAMRKRKRNIVVLILAAAALVVLLHAVVVQAFFDEETAVQIDPSKIENSTLIIGTHLIYLNSLNDEIYAIAQESASDSAQSNIYYKSELADGTWFDITDAGSISDITTSGQVVSDDTIRGLYFTHHTKSDGITYDLRTNSPVCIFDIYDAYDLENMTELQSVKNQYDMYKDSESMSDTDRRNLKLMTAFFATEVHTSETDEYDQKISALQSYYEQLVSGDVDSSETEAVMNVMAKLDNARREIVYTLVETALDDLMDKVADGTSDEDGVEYYDISDTLLTAIGNSQSDLSESMIEAQSNLFEEGSTVLSQKEYELDQSLVSDAMSSNFAGCDETVVKLIALGNISSELIVSRSSELSLLEELLPMAEKKYSNALKAGPSAEYKAAVEAKSSHAVLDNILKADAAVVNSARSELEFLVKAKADRLDSDEAQSYIKAEIEATADLLAAIPNDDYSETMKASVEKYQMWQAEELAGLKSGTGSAVNDLYEQKEALEEERLEALDDENLDLANLLAAKIETIDEQIAAAEKASDSELTSLQNQLLEINDKLEENPTSAYLLTQKTDLEAQIADITSGLSDASAASSIQELKNAVLSDLAKDEISASMLSEMETDVEGLGGMLSSGSGLALSALKEIYKKMVALSYLDDNSDLDSLITKIEDLVAGSEVLETEQNGLSQEAALSTIEDVLGGSISVSGVGSGSESGTGSSSGSGTDSSAENGTGSSAENGTGSSAGDGSGSGSESGTGSSAGNGTGNSSGSGSDSDTSAGGSSGTANSQVSIEGLSEKEVLAAMLALGEFAKDTNNEDIAALAGGIAANLSRSQEASVFETKKDQDTAYVPADQLAQFSGYRYLWNATKKTAILSKGRTYFSFTAFFSGVDTGQTEMEYMDTETQFSGGTVYIPNSYVSSRFGCEIYNISDTGYSVLADDSTVALSEELLEALLEKGGG